MNEMNEKLERIEILLEDILEELKCLVKGMAEETEEHDWRCRCPLFSCMIYRTLPCVKLAFAQGADNMSCTWDENQWDDDIGDW